MLTKLTATLLSLICGTLLFAAPNDQTGNKPPKARRRIVISSLGPAPLQIQPADHQSAVETMIAHWKRELEQVLPDRPDLIVLPEACDRYPAMNKAERLSYYRFRGDKIRDFFRDVARQNRCYIAYSAAREMPDGTWRNSTQLIDRNGEIAGIYNKNYPTVGETAVWGIRAGKDSPVFQTDFGRVGMVICFDLNFHEVLERYARQRPDLIIFSSMYHGGLMQGYWAYHCRSYFIGAIAGKENNILNPLGARIAHSTFRYQYVTATVNLDYQVIHLDGNLEKLAALKKKYGRGVTIFDPDYVGAVLLTSELDDVTSEEMVKEFDIELWDHYYKRSVDFRNLPTSLEP